MRLRYLRFNALIGIETAMDRRAAYNQAYDLFVLSLDIITKYSTLL